MTPETFRAIVFCVMQVTMQQATYILGIAMVMQHDTNSKLIGSIINCGDPSGPHNTLQKIRPKGGSTKVRPFTLLFRKSFTHIMWSCPLLMTLVWIWQTKWEEDSYFDYCAKALLFLLLYSSFLLVLFSLLSLDSCWIPRATYLHLI